MPMPFDWARDINKSNCVSPVVSVDTMPTKYVDKAMIPPSVTYGPHDLSALFSGTQNLWGTLSCHHH